MSEATLKTCPSCKQETLIRLIDGGAGMLFKGSGFYSTDYRKPEGSDKSTTAKKPETPATPKTESPKTAEPAKSGDSSTPKK